MKTSTEIVLKSGFLGKRSEGAVAHNQASEHPLCDR
jgi:hypothetical protein